MSPGPNKTLSPSMRLSARLFILLGFAGSVMADPVSSVAYSIESGLRHLEGDPTLLGLTMATVLVIIGVVTANYWQVIGLFPDGGGSAEAAGAVLGTGWVFVPFGALVVDFLLTIAISVSAAASAIVAFVPALEHFRVGVACALLAFVTTLVLSGARGRLVLAGMTALFVGGVVHVVFAGVSLPLFGGSAASALAADPGGSVWHLLFAVSASMALATGVEAPASSIAELDTLTVSGRIRAGRTTLLVTVIVVVVATIGLTMLVLQQDAGIPPKGQTLISHVVRQAIGDGLVFDSFQFVTCLLLLAAASSSLQAGPGLTKALSLGGVGHTKPLLPSAFARSVHGGVPWIGVGVFALVSAALVVAVGAAEQQLVQFYAVAVFVAFAFGLAAMMRHNLRERRTALLIVNSFGLLAVGTVLAVNLLRGWPLLAVLASIAIAIPLWDRWRRSGRPKLSLAAHAQP